MVIDLQPLLLRLDHENVQRIDNDRLYAEGNVFQFDIASLNVRNIQLGTSQEIDLTGNSVQGCLKVIP